jgi:hypothetical protein
VGTLRPPGHLRRSCDALEYFGADGQAIAPGRRPRAGGPPLEMPPQPHLARSRPPAVLRQDDVDHQWLLSAAVISVAVAIARMLMAVTLSTMRLRLISSSASSSTSICSWMRACGGDIGPAAHVVPVNDDVVKRIGDEHLGLAEGAGKFTWNCAGGEKTGVSNRYRYLTALNPGSPGLGIHPHPLAISRRRWRRGVLGHDGLIASLVTSSGARLPVRFRNLPVRWSRRDMTHGYSK